jgi:transposase
MSNLFGLTEEQMERLTPFFPKSHRKPRADDRRVLSSIIFFNRNGLRWCDAPREYGPPKTLCNRWKQWGDMGVFARVMEGLASEGGNQKTIIIGATGLKAHRGALPAAGRRTGRAAPPRHPPAWGEGSGQPVGRVRWGRVHVD